MPASHATQPSTTGFSFTRRLKEIDLFFEKRGKEHKTLRRLVKKLEKAGIPYAIVGGMAVNIHRHERTTHDVDVLLSHAGFKAFCDRFVPKGYARVAGRTRRLLDRKHEVTINILVSGGFPGSGKPGPIAYPDPAEVGQRIDQWMVVNLVTLVQLKLAARRYQDFGDVVALIRVNNLDESFKDRLHPTLQQDYLSCLNEKRREDEYEAREAQEP